MSLRLSLRVQWILSLTIATAATVAVVVVVEVVGPGNPATPAAPLNQAVVREGNREAIVLVGLDQAAHSATLAHGASARSGLTAVLRAYVARRISLGQIGGPLQGTSCNAVAGASPGRLVFSCRVQAGDVYYPFDGVVVPSRRQITFCKRDYPPVPNLRIPVSARCT